MTTVTSCAAPCEYASGGICTLECLDLDDSGDCRQYEETDDDE